MMRQYELVEKVATYNPQVNEELLNRAYVYAMRKHGSQTRASGDLYFSHPLEVAAILTDLKLDDASIAVGLLHDTIEDTDATRGEIEQTFGSEIAKLVDGLTKLDRLDLVSREERQAENLRKLLLAVADDIRVLLVKLADRLHNMRTIEHVSEAKRARIAAETMEIYAPLAGRMGMQAMRDELEDSAFRILNPDAYKTISEKLASLKDRTGDVVDTIRRDLALRLSDSGIEAAIMGRQKRPYSIFSKMERKSVGFEQLSDIFGFRVLVESEEACYRALGVVHMAWRMVPGRFKDYISTPKQNDYRSLHTTIIGPRQQRVELQIRSHAMDRTAEFGIAAHPLYKEGVVRDRDRLARESSAYAWLRQTVEHIAHGDAAEEFLEHTKLELFQDQVFCFTPKGRLIALPRGATPIDFAYAVHTDVGDTCGGAKVNGRIASLVQPLENGDEVQIIRSEAHRPPAAWESVVATGKARAAIRRATRAHTRRQYIGLGRHILKTALAKAGHSYADTDIERLLPRLGRTQLDEALHAVGRGEIGAEAILRLLYPERRDAKAKDGNGAATEDGWFCFGRPGLKFRWPEGPRSGEGEVSTPLHGLGVDMDVRFAPNGGALPGDRIVGILTMGEGITIYPIQSPALGAFEDEVERWLDVRWDLEGVLRQRFSARIEVAALNEPGSLAEIAAVIGASDGNIDNLKMVERERDITRMEIDLEVFDLKHLNRIIAELKAKPMVSRAVRING